MARRSRSPLRPWLGLAAALLLAASRAPAALEQLAPEEEMPAQPRSDTVALFRWYPGDEGSERVGTLPGDLDLDLVEESAIGTGGIVAWRNKGLAGEEYLLQPWLLREGGSSLDLAKPESYADTALAWLPGERGVVVNAVRAIRLFDPGGRPPRHITLDRFRVLKVAVHPGAGNIAAFILPTKAFDLGEETLRPLDLVVLSPEGRQLSRLKNAAQAWPVDSSIEAPALFWLPGERLAYLRTSGRLNETGAPEGFLVIATPAEGTVEATALRQEPVAVTSQGKILLSDNRLYDPATRRAVPLPLPEAVWLPRQPQFSPDGHWLTAAQVGMGGTTTLGVVGVADGDWHEIAKSAAALGWSPGGALYWVHTPPPDIGFDRSLF